VLFLIDPLKYLFYTITNACYINFLPYVRINQKTKLLYM